MESEKMNRKRSYSRMVIRQALLDILKATPLSKVTVTDICKRADVNRTTFYANYEDIYDLLRSIVQELHDEIQQVLVQYKRIDGLAYYNALLDTIRDNWDVCYAALRISDQEYEEIGVDFRYRSIMEAGVRRSSQADPVIGELIFDYVLSGTQSIISNWMEGGMQTPSHVIAEVLYTINGALLKDQRAAKEQKTR